MLTRQFASPSIDMPYMQGRAGAGLAGLAPAGMTFEQQPNIGGLGILGQSAGQGGYYPQQNMVRRLSPHTGWSFRC